MPQFDEETLAKHTFMQAEGFALAYNVLTQPVFAQQSVFTANAMIVLSAFASELFLKCLRMLEGWPFPRTHDLNDLFDLLQPETKARITALWDAEVEKTKDQWLAGGTKLEDLKLLPALRVGGKAFETLRYSHEGEVNLRFVLGDLPYVPRTAIIETKPEWDKIERAYQVDTSKPGVTSTRTRTVGHPQGPQVKQATTKAD